MADRNTLLKEINEISFALDDLTLYLDTHPADSQALDEFSLKQAKRKELLETFAKHFEPLTRNCVRPDTNNQTQFLTTYPAQKHFTWTDGPLPWENVGGAI